MQIEYNQISNILNGWYKSLIVEFTKGVILFYIQLRYIIYEAHAIIMTDEYWMECLFINFKEHSDFLKSICDIMGITIKKVKYF